MAWKKLKIPRLGKAIYSFPYENPRFLNLKLGDTIIITEECKDWFHGYLLLDSNTNVHGIFPKSYIRVLKSDTLKRQVSVGESATCQNLKDEILDEMVSILHEWFPTWRELFLDGEPMAKTVETIISEFLAIYEEINSAPLTTRQLLDKRTRMVRKIDFVNSKINHDLIPRVDDRPVEVEDYSFVELYEIHEESVTRSKNLTQRGSMRHLSSMSTTTSYRLQMHMSLCDFDSTDNIELVWNIFNGRNNTILCEPYHQFVKCDDQSTWRSSIVFEEFFSEEILDELHLLVNIYRVGRLNPELSSGKNHRIPHGFSGMIINKCFRQKTNENIKILPWKHTNAASISCFIRSIDLSIIPDKNIEESVHLYPPNMPIMQRLTMRERPSSKIDRDNLYVDLSSGEFEKGNKSTPKNIEVKVTVRDVNGEPLELFQGIENKSVYLSAVHPRNNSPNFKEIIQICLPDTNSEDLHLLFEFYHCTGQKVKNSEASLFAFSCLSICKNGIPIQNGSYTLTIKRENNPKKLIPSEYTKSSFLLSESIEKERDTFVINTSLCSTKRLQNPRAMAFLNWHNIINNEEMETSLESIRKLNYTDLCKPYIKTKIVSNILDVLFSQPSFSIPNFEIEVFITLQHVVCELKDKGADISFVEALIQRNAAANILKLLKCINKLLQNFLQGNSNCLDTAQFALYNIDYIIQQIKHVEDKNTQEECISLITKICNYNIFLMDSDQQVHQAIHEVILEHFPRTIAACGSLLSGSLKSSYIQGVLKSKSLENYKMSKLKFIQEVFNCDFCRESAIFSALYPLIEKNILEHTNEASEYLHISMTIWGGLLKILPGVEDEYKDVIISKLLKNFLCRAICILRFIQERRKTAGLILACILTLLNEIFPSNANHDGYFFRHQEEFNELVLQEILEILKINVQANLYNHDWIVLLAQTSKITLSVTDSLSEHMKTNPRGVDLQIWSAFLDLCFNFILWNFLQLQNHPLYRKHKILSKYGDLRVEMMKYTLIAWKLGTNFESSPELVSIRRSLLSRLLQISLLPETTVRTKALPLLCSAFHAWFPTKEQNLSLKQTLVANLEEYLSEGKGDYNYLELLFNLASTSEHEETSEIAGQFEALIRYHLELRDVMNSDENRRKHVFCLGSLMEFYRNVFPMERFFIHYLYQLIQLLTEEEYFLEAALALDLHSQLLDWVKDDKKTYILPKDACSTKESAYCNMINLFDKAMAWEYAIPFMEELRRFYSSIYNYSLLSHILTVEAKFYENMMKEYRQSLTYFRVTFVGSNYPSFLKAKDFVYKGSPYFKLGTFQTQLKADFPGCEILSPQIAANRVFKDDDKAIILTEVKPVPFDEAVEKNPEIPSFVKMFHRSYRVSKFTFDRSYHVGKVDSNNEMKTLCIERTTVETKEVMPCLSLWCPIVKVESHILSPVQTAADALAKKMAELESLTSEYKTNPGKDLRPFTMKLQGTLDAGVNGGVQKYIDAFFTDEYSQSIFYQAGDLLELKVLFLKQIDVLDKAIQIHGELVSEQIRDLHNRFLDCFNGMKNLISKSGSPRPNDMVPVTPVRRNIISLDNSLKKGDEPTLQLHRKSTNNMLSQPMTRPGRTASILQDDTSQILFTLSGNRLSSNNADTSGLSSGHTSVRESGLSRDDTMSDWSEVFEYNRLDSKNEESDVQVTVQGASSNDDLCSVKSDKSTRSCPSSPTSLSKSPKSQSLGYKTDVGSNKLSFSNKQNSINSSNKSLNEDRDIIGGSLTSSPEITRKISYSQFPSWSSANIQPPAVERMYSSQPTEKEIIPRKSKLSNRSPFKTIVRQISHDFMPGSQSKTLINKSPPDIPPGSVERAKKNLLPNLLSTSLKSGSVEGLSVQKQGDQLKPSKLTRRQSSDSHNFPASNSSSK